MAEMIRIHLHCDNIYDHIPDSERFVPYEEGSIPSGVSPLEEMWPAVITSRT